jgi:hypothetical protein
MMVDQHSLSTNASMIVQRHEFGRSDDVQDELKPALNMYLVNNKEIYTPNSLFGSKATFSNYGFGHNTNTMINLNFCNLKHIHMNSNEYNKNQLINI